MRIGHGFDAHRLVEGRPLVLGGVHVPFERGALGHSDGDALWKDADSLVLLKKCAAAVREAGYDIGNVDATIVLDQPKLGGFVGEMRAKIASCLDLDASLVNVKAKRSEGMGYTGDGTGVAAYAVVLLSESGVR